MEAALAGIADVWSRLMLDLAEHKGALKLRSAEEVPTCLPACLRAWASLWLDCIIFSFCWPWQLGQWHSVRPGRLHRRALLLVLASDCSGCSSRMCRCSPRWRTMG